MKVLPIIISLLILVACTAQTGVTERAPDTCSKPEVREVQGASMDPLFRDGENITLLMGYYSCHNVSRDDVVVYEHIQNSTPIIKRVRGMPGDNWTLLDNSSAVAILVNGQVLTNSAGAPYEIPTNGARMLKLYAQDYPIIPHDAYLLLGEDVHGSLDATSFGLVTSAGFIGKVAIPSSPR